MNRTALLVLFPLICVTTSASGMPVESSLPTVMDLGQALSLFHARGLDLLIAEATVMSAEGDVRIAGAIANPQLSIGYGRSFYTSCATPCPSVPSAYSVQISDSGALEDTLSGKRGLRLEVANAALRAARLGRADADRTLVFQVKALFEQMLIAQNALAFAREIATANTQLLDRTEAQAKEGKIAPSDVLRVRVAKLEAEQAVDQAIQTVRTARAQLAFMLGERASVPEFTVEQPELADYAIPPKLATATRDSLLASAFAARPDLQAQQAQLDTATSQLRLDHRRRFPDIALSLGYSQAGAASDTSVSPPTFTIGLATTLPVFYQLQGELQKDEAGLRTQEALLAKNRGQIVSDVEVAYADYVGSLSLVRRMKDGTLLETAKAADAAVKLQWEKGAASLLDYLIAHSTYVQTEVEYLNDLGSYWTAVFNLEHAVGVELR